VVVWADPQAQHLSFMPMTDDLRHSMTTALQATPSEELSTIVFDELPVSYRSIRYGDHSALYLSLCFSQHLTSTKLWNS
jgi:hypothetical protein